jgi:hypothetical protein
MMPSPNKESERPEKQSLAICGLNILIVMAMDERAEPILKDIANAVCDNSTSKDEYFRLAIMAAAVYVNRINTKLQEAGLLSSDEEFLEMMEKE